MKCENCNKRFAEGFKKGQLSILRKNESGCCCIIDDNDKIVSSCGAHLNWLDEKLAAYEKDIITLTLRLIGEDSDTFSPEVTEVMSRWSEKARNILNPASKPCYICGKTEGHEAFCSKGK